MVEPHKTYKMDSMPDFEALLLENRFTCGDDTNREPLGSRIDVHPGERNDGLLNMDGKRYWASVQCGVCKYEWSFPKLLAHAARGQLDLQMFHGSKAAGNKPWKGICCKSCWFARKRPCKCRCRRINHQRGIQRVMEDYNQGFEQNKPFFQAYIKKGTEDAHAIFMQSREKKDDK